LLTKAAGESASGAAGDERIAFQRRVEDKYRAQVVQLLTPLVGSGNFSTEVQADVDLDETQATRESYDKQGALRAEQGNWTGNQADAAQPGGIPGALSNTPPPASTVTAPTPAVPGATAAPGTAPPPNVKQSDQFARAYDLGKEVSVTRAAPGGVKRLSVAVLLRDIETAKPRSQVEIQQITQLVQTAVGFNQGRGDQVTVISRKFAGAAQLDGGQPWYDNAWLPIIARNVTAIVIALLVLLLGVRPLAKAMMKKREDASARPALGRDMGTAASSDPTPPAVSIDQIDSAQNYDDRIGMVRGFTRDNPARAALAVRDMIKS
jgi:flagellar M-ring protein FliF